MVPRIRLRVVESLTLCPQKSHYAPSHRILAPRPIGFLSGSSAENSPKNCVHFLNGILYRTPIRHGERDGSRARGAASRRILERQFCGEFLQNCVHCLNGILYRVPITTRVELARLCTRAAAGEWVAGKLLTAPATARGSVGGCVGRNGGECNTIRLTQRIEMIGLISQQRSYNAYELVCKTTIGFW